MPHVPVSCPLSIACFPGSLSRSCYRSLLMTIDDVCLRGAGQYTGNWLM